MDRYAAAVVLCVLGVACTPEAGRERDVARTPSPSRSIAVAPQKGLPPKVAATRAAILTAAADHDYDALREVLEPNVFLSDFGFGIDPTDRWKRKGEAPIELMAALLRMAFVESDSNEGRLYKWPTYDAETKAVAEISRRDREMFLSVLSREEFRRLVPNLEYGYVGPRLGILEDGTWWFFVEGGGP